MNLETINETVNVCRYLGYEKRSTYIDGDLILQDIKPDILSIVKINRDVCVSNIRKEDGKVKIEGDVNIGVIYIADDEGNTQRGISSKINFSEVIEFKDVDEESVIKLRYEVGNVEYKVINGRKISLKIPVTFHVKAFSNCDIDIIKGIRDDNDMQTQKMIQNLCSPISTNGTNVELKETLKLNEENSPIGEILECSLCITNREYKISYNKILAKADAKVKVVYIADNERQNIESFETMVPVMGFIDCEGVNEGSKITLDYIVNDYLIRPSYQDMQATSILLDANIQINSYTYECRDVELITDFYTPNMNLKAETKTNEILKNLIEHEENIILSQTLVVPELSNTNILGIDGCASINDKNILNGKIALAGNIDINILYSKKDSKIIENKKLELPFQQVIKIDDINKNMQPIIYVEVDEITYSQNGDNQIEVRTPLRVNVLADNEEEINSITNLEASTESLPQMPSIVIYFVKPGDTLWNIAKNFRSTVEYIKEVNELKDDIIYPGQRLLIPRLQMANNANMLIRR